MAHIPKTSIPHNNAPELLKPYGVNWEAFQTLIGLLKKSHQWHYTRNEIGSFHQALEKFRHTSGWERLQSNVRHTLFRQEYTQEEQGFQNIDDGRGDRSFLNNLILQYARSLDEALYHSVVEPQLKSLKSNKNDSSKIPMEADGMIFIINPLVCFSLLNEVREYQDRIQQKTRWLYIETFINRWFSKFNQFVLQDKKKLGKLLYRIFYGKTVTESDWQNLQQFISQVVPVHLSNSPMSFSKETRHNLQILYLILQNLMYLALKQNFKLPEALVKILSELDYLPIFSRNDYIRSGARSSYETFHLLPDLFRKVESVEQKQTLAQMSKKRFINFWNKYSALPTDTAKVHLCCSFTKKDQLFVLEQLHRYGQDQALVKLHDTTERILNGADEAAKLFQIGGRGSKLLNQIWAIHKKYKLKLKMESDDSKKRKESQLQEGEFEISKEEREQRRKRDWRRLTIHDVPAYTKVKRWPQITKLPFDLPQNQEILFSFMPYVKLNEKRTQDRLTIAQCVELCRLAFKYLVSDIENRYKFNFITMGDLLLMKISGPMVQSSQSLFRFLNDSGQLKEPKMMEMLIKVYPSIEFHFGELLRENIPYVINHRYAYKGGGINGINAGVAIERINRIEIEKSPYLCAGKLFLLLAESIFKQAIYAINPSFVVDEQDISKEDLQNFIKQNTLSRLIELGIAQNKKQLYLFDRWWKTQGASQQEKWMDILLEEIYKLHHMFFHRYPNPYILPTY